MGSVCSMRKRDYLAGGMAASGLFSLFGALRRMRRVELPILAYHRICDVPDEDAFPFDLELVSASPSAFAWQMRYVKNNFQPITFQNLIDALDGAKPLPERPIIITFDDGTSDNHEHAFPVLRELGIPATFFISTDYIGRQRPFWFDFVAHVLYQAPAGIMKFGDLELVLELHDTASRRQGMQTLLRALKRVTETQRRKFMADLEVGYAPIVDESRFWMSRPLDWEQVREMHVAGMEFGSHTVTHPILARMDDTSIRRELVDSRARLYQELGDSVPVLAYPVGEQDAFDDRVVGAMRSAGYRFGVSYVEGVNRLDRLSPYALRRQHVERTTSRQYFMGMLQMPELFW